MSNLPHDLRPPADRADSPPAGSAAAATTAASDPDPDGISFGRTALHILLSLGVLAIIGYFTYDPAAFRQMVRALNPWWLAAAVGSVGVRVFFGGWRLAFISQGRLDLAAALRGQLAWDFFSNVTPSAVGGSPLATIYIAKDTKLPIGEVTAFMLFSVLLDQCWLALSIPLTLVAAFYFDVFPDTLGTIGTGAFITYFVLMLAWVVLLGYATIFRPDLIHELAGRLFRLRFIRRFRERVLHELQQLERHAALLRTQPLSFYAKGFLLTLGTWAGRYVLGLFIVWSVYENVDKLLFLLRSMAMLLGTMILPTPGGSGGVEGLYWLFLAPLMPAALVAPTLLTWRILGYYIFIALGAFLSAHQVHKTLRRKRDAAAPVAPQPRLEAKQPEATRTMPQAEPVE